MGFVSLPYTPVNGDTITATNTLNDLNAIINVVNGALDNTNLSPTAAVKGSQISAAANLVGTQLSPSANILGTQLSASANILMSQLSGTSELRIIQASGADSFSTNVTGDTKRRCSITSDGFIRLSGGVSAYDISIERGSAGLLHIKDGTGSFANLRLSDLTALGNVNLCSSTVVITPSTVAVTGNMDVSGTFTLSGNPLRTFYGGTGANLSSFAAGSVPYMVGTGLNPMTCLAGGAAVANKVVGWNGSGNALVALSPSVAQFTLNNASASFGTSGFASFNAWEITASSAINVTLQASPADGTTYRFAIVTGTAGVTLTANGVQTISNGPRADTTLTLAGSQSGSVDIMAVAGGWRVV